MMHANQTARRWIIAVLGVAAGLLCGCASSAPKAANPGIVRFVGTWSTDPSGSGAVLKIAPDQRATIALSAPGERGTTIAGRCNPGADTVTFAEDDGPRSEHRVFLFATRPDGSLATMINGVSLRLRRP